MHGADRALQEPSFTVGEIEVPQAKEVRLIPQLPDLRKLRDNVPPPGTQGRGVVRPDIFEVNQSQITDLRRCLCQSVDGRDATARENEPLDKIDGSFCSFVESFVDRDALDEGQPLRLQHAAADLEKRSVILMPDRLDHFDGDEFVELRGELRQISIVHEQHPDAIAQAGFPNALQCHVILLLRDGRSRYAATIVRSGVDGEATPA